MDCNSKPAINPQDLTPEILPQGDDFKVQEIEEGNKKYYRIAGLMVSANAYKNLHNLATAKGLSIRLNPGGCSGFKYIYDFFAAPQEDEKTYQLSEKISLFLNDFTFSKSYGSIVDFSVGLHGSGLKIINPKVKRSCSCGTSMGF